jgi:hypothetical protein
MKQVFKIGLITAALLTLFVQCEKENPEDNSSDGDGSIAGVNHLQVINTMEYERYFHIKMQGESEYHIDYNMVIAANDTGYYYHLDKGVYLYEASSYAYENWEFHDLVTYSSGQLNMDSTGMKSHKIME